MPVFRKFQPFVRGLINGDHDFGADVLRVALTTQAASPSSLNDNLADLTQIAYTNQRGGAASRVLTVSKATQAAGVALVEVNDLVITASGTLPTFRHVVIYNTNSADPVSALIGWYDYGSDIDLATNETLTIDFTPASGLFTIT